MYTSLTLSVLQNTDDTTWSSGSAPCPKPSTGLDRVRIFLCQPECKSVREAKRVGGCLYYASKKSLKVRVYNKGKTVSCRNVCRQTEIICVLLLTAGWHRAYPCKPQHSPALSSDRNKQSAHLLIALTHKCSWCLLKCLYPHQQSQNPHHLPISRHIVQRLINYYNDF